MNGDDEARYFEQFTRQEICADTKLFARWLYWKCHAGLFTRADIEAAARMQPGEVPPVPEDFTGQALEQADDILSQAAGEGDRLYFKSPGDRYDHQHFYRVAIRQANAILRAAAGDQPVE